MTRWWPRRTWTRCGGREPGRESGRRAALLPTPALPLLHGGFPLRRARVRAVCEGVRNVRPQCRERRPADPRVLVVEQAHERPDRQAVLAVAEQWQPARAAEGFDHA